MAGNVKPPAKPRNRPHSQHNPTGGGDGGDGVGEQTQMVDLRNNRRSLDCTHSDYSAAGGTTANSWETKTKTTPCVPNTVNSNTAGGPIVTAAGPPKTAGGPTQNSWQPRTNTAGGSSVTAGGPPKAAARPSKAAESNNVQPTAVRVENPSRNNDTGIIRGYLTRPWNSSEMTPGARQIETTHLNGNVRTGNSRGYAPWNSNERLLSSENDLESSNVTQTRSRPYQGHDLQLRQSGALNTDDDDEVEAGDFLTDRRNSDDSVANFELRRASSVQAKKQFMVGSYVILFVGILLAVSGAVLTVLAFHNHFGHISIGQQWSLAGIVLMTIGICLLLTYTVTAAKNKYWAVQEDIHLDNSSGNYSRNLEQGARVYIPAPIGRSQWEDSPDPPGGYYPRPGEVGAAPPGYYRLTRSSPSSGAASTGQVTESSSVDMEEEPKQPSATSQQRMKRLYNNRYDVAGHEVESDSPSDGSGQSRTDRARYPPGVGGGYRGRTLRPAPGLPAENPGERNVAPPARSSASSASFTPTRSAPEAPKGLPNQVTAQHPNHAKRQTPIPDLIPSIQTEPRTELGQGHVEGHVESQGQPEVTKLRPAPVLPAIARQARLRNSPPRKVHLHDLPPHSEIAMPSTALPQAVSDAQKAPEKVGLPKAGISVEGNCDNSEAQQPARKPSRQAPGIPVDPSGGRQGVINASPGAIGSSSGSVETSRPTPTSRVSTKQPGVPQAQQYCCVENRDGIPGQCSCGEGEGEAPGALGGHEGPYTGSSDDELAGDGPRTSAGARGKKPLPPPVMKKPTRRYEDPPEEGAPPCYDEITH